MYHFILPRTNFARVADDRISFPEMGDDEYTEYLTRFNEQQALARRLMGGELNYNENQHEKDSGAVNSGDFLFFGGGDNGFKSGKNQVRISKEQQQEKEFEPINNAMDDLFKQVVDPLTMTGFKIGPRPYNVVYSASDVKTPLTIDKLARMLVYFKFIIKKIDEHKEKWGKVGTKKIRNSIKAFAENANFVIPLVFHLARANAGRSDFVVPPLDSIKSISFADITIKNEEISDLITRLHNPDPQQINDEEQPMPIDDEEQPIPDIEQDEAKRAEKEDLIDFNKALHLRLTKEQDSIRTINKELKDWGFDYRNNTHVIVDMDKLKNYSMNPLIMMFEDLDSFADIYEQFPPNRWDLANKQQFVNLCKSIDKTLPLMLALRDANMNNTTQKIIVPKLTSLPAAKWKNIVSQDNPNLKLNVSVTLFNGKDSAPTDNLEPPPPTKKASAAPVNKNDIINVDPPAPASEVRTDTTGANGVGFNVAPAQEQQKASVDHEKQAGISMTQVKEIDERGRRFIEDNFPDRDINNPETQRKALPKRLNKLQSAVLGNYEGIKDETVATQKEIKKYIDEFNRHGDRLRKTMKRRGLVMTDKGLRYKNSKTDEPNFDPGFKRTLDVQISDATDAYIELHDKLNEARGINLPSIQEIMMNPKQTPDDRLFGFLKSGKDMTELASYLEVYNQALALQNNLNNEGTYPDLKEYKNSYEPPFGPNLVDGLMNKSGFTRIADEMDESTWNKKGTEQYLPSTIEVRNAGIENIADGSDAAQIAAKNRQDAIQDAKDANLESDDDYDNDDILNKPAWGIKRTHPDYEDLKLLKRIGPGNYLALKKMKFAKKLSDERTTKKEKEQKEKEEKAEKERQKRFDEGINFFLKQAKDEKGDGFWSWRGDGDLFSKMQNWDPLTQPLNKNFNNKNPFFLNPYMQNRLEQTVPPYELPKNYPIYGGNIGGYPMQQVNTVPYNIYSRNGTTGRLTNFEKTGVPSVRMFQMLKKYGMTAEQYQQLMNQNRGYAPQYAMQAAAPLPPYGQQSSGAPSMNDYASTAMKVAKGLMFTPAKYSSSMNQVIPAVLPNGDTAGPTAAYAMAKIVDNVTPQGMTNKEKMAMIANRIKFQDLIDNTKDEESKKELKNLVREYEPPKDGLMKRGLRTLGKAASLGLKGVGFVGENWWPIHDAYHRYKTMSAVGRTLGKAAPAIMGLFPAGFGYRKKKGRSKKRSKVRYGGMIIQPKSLKKMFKENKCDCKY